MPKIDWDSILVYIGFVILIILASILFITKLTAEVFEGAADAPMYSRPTLSEEIEDTTITSTEVTTVETDLETENTGMDLYE